MDNIKPNGEGVTRGGFIKGLAAAVASAVGGSRPDTAEAQQAGRDLTAEEINDSHLERFKNATMIIAAGAGSSFDILGQGLMDKAGKGNRIPRPKAKTQIPGGSGALGMQRLSSKSAADLEREGAFTINGSGVLAQRFFPGSEKSGIDWGRLDIVASFDSPMVLVRRKRSVLTETVIGYTTPRGTLGILTHCLAKLTQKSPAALNGTVKISGGEQSASNVLLQLQRDEVNAAWVTVGDLARLESSTPGGIEIVARPSGNVQDIAEYSAQRDDVWDRFVGEFRNSPTFADLLPHQSDAEYLQLRDLADFGSAMSELYLNVYTNTDDPNARAYAQIVKELAGGELRLADGTVLKHRDAGATRAARDRLLAAGNNLRGVFKQIIEGK